MSLSPQETQMRLTRLRNLETMYANQVEANDRLKAENTQLKLKVIELQSENENLKKRVQALELIVEELRRMIFKGKSKELKASSNKTNIDKDGKNKKIRNKESYRRATPDISTVTEVIVYDIHQCNHCNQQLSDIKEVVRYIEDMLLPSESQYHLKKVIQEYIHKGYCTQCKKRSYAKTIPSQHCCLGNGIRSFIVYAVTVMALSYDQVQNFLKTMVNIDISDGEIVSILKHESVALLPEYKSLQERIRAGPGVHYDETSRKVQSTKGQSYAWVMASIDGLDRVYTLGNNRGGGNLEQLKGNSEAIGISDDYGAYKNAFRYHQLCWAHPIRKLRDLTTSEKLNVLQINICKVVYDEIRLIHNEIVEALSKGRSFITLEMKNKRKERFLNLSISMLEEPEKLTAIRKSLKKNNEKYFTCLDFDNIPTTNNVAERALRPLVIKRKLSFGSKTLNGSSMMERIYSIVFSLTAKTKSHFFDQYRLLKC